MRTPPSACVRRTLAAACLAVMAVVAGGVGASMGTDTTSHEVFAGQGFYTERPEPEQSLTGKIIHRPVAEGPNTRRFAYRLQGAGFDYALYSTPSTIDLIRSLAGRTVTVTGKLIDQSDDGGEVELWAAAIRKE